MTTSRTTLLTTRRDLSAWLMSLPDALDEGQGTCIYDGRNRVVRFTMAGETLIVKQFRRPRGIQRLAYSTFWPNKAVKAYRFAQRLLDLGIDTPAPIAALTVRSRWHLVDRFVLVTAECRWPDCLALRDDPTLDDRQGLIDALAAYIASLHDRHFLHGDTNLSNFLRARQPDGSYRFSVIDINRSRFTREAPTREQCLSNLFRLTHVRPLLHALVAAYASARGWDAAESLAYVERCTARFERRKRILRALRGRK